jgi:hypothetical protein
MDDTAFDAKRLAASKCRQAALRISIRSGASVVAESLGARSARAALFISTRRQSTRPRNSATLKLTDG